MSHHRPDEPTPSDPYASPPSGPPSSAVPPGAPSSPGASYPPPPPPGYPAPTYSGGGPYSGPPYSGVPPRPGNSALAVTALIVAILALLICWIPIIGAGACLVALILAIIAWAVSQRGRRPIGMSVAATVISALGLVIGVVLTIVFFQAIVEDVREAEEYCSTTTTNQRDFDRCVEERGAENFLERFGIEPTP